MRKIWKSRVIPAQMVVDTPKAPSKLQTRSPCPSANGQMLRVPPAREISAPSSPTSPTQPMRILGSTGIALERGVGVIWDWCATLLAFCAFACKVVCPAHQLFAFMCVCVCDDLLKMLCSELAEMSALFYPSSHLHSKRNPSNGIFFDAINPCRSKSRKWTSQQPRN